MEQKNFKKCHSRNLDQTDLILDFLSNLDKSKNSFTWRDELNQINQDWTHMMKEKWRRGKVLRNINVDSIRMIQVHLCLQVRG